MSQVSIIDIEGNHPQIPTEFVANVGTAIPLANVLEILGETVVAGVVPIETVASGNTVTIQVQLSQAIGASNALNVGLAAFDSTDFSVDANGFVSLAGGVGAVDSIGVDASTAPGTNPVIPDGIGLITVIGAQVASGDVGVNVIRTNSIAANQYTIEIQRTTSSAIANSAINGVSHFDSANFTVDSNGFVQLDGATVGQTITGDAGGALSPTAGNWNILGGSVVAGTSPVATSGAGSTLTINVQKAQAIAATDATKVGLANFNSAQFSVDANGFVSTSGTGIANTITGQSGGALSPTAGNWNIYGASTAAGTSPVVTSGSVSTLTVNVQKAQAIAATDATKIGLANFDSAAFDVDANGFVQLNGGGIAVTSIDVQANTAPGTDPVVPSAAGVITVNGAAVANHSVVLETRSRAANAYNLEVQYATSAAATDATKSGVAHFNSTSFSVDANGFVSLSGSIGAGTITGDTGGALSQTAGNWNIVSTATNGIDTSGSGSTLTIGMASPYGDGSFSFSRSVSGATNTLTVANTSNTASSNALQQVTVAGTSAGDAFITYTVTGTTNWSHGIDNSVTADPFVLSASTALGTSNTLVVETTGNATFNNVATSAELSLACLNSDTNAASNSRIVAAVVAASAADPYLQVGINAVSNYCYGIDNSDSDSLKICFDANAASATPSGSSNLWKMSSVGERTMPLQPAFLAVVGSNLTDKTGAGGSYTLGTDALTEIFDQGGDFNTNGTFTAPVTGRYDLKFVCLLSGASAATSTLDIRIQTSNRTYLTQSCGATINNGSGNAGLISGALADMDAADTSIFALVASGGTATADIYGSTSVPGTYVSGFLVC